MQVSQLNNVNVYNLSSGKSLPEWLSDRKKRQLLKQDSDVRRRIELIQEFTMPTASNCIKVSKDQNYIIASGVYKPRIKCFDVNQLSLKFERCFDANAVQFELLSDDFSKIVLLQSDRYVEFHAQYGRYYRTRIPKFGRDLAYHSPSCDLYFAGAGSEVYRLNLEQGRFMEPLSLVSLESNVCRINPINQLLAVGSTDGKVECFDPRSKSSVGVLDIAKDLPRYNLGHQITAVTALSFKDGLEMGVGLSSGHVLLYDIRSSDPVLIKDHSYGLKIQNVIFHEKSDKIISADSKVIKIWERNNGDIFTSIEPESSINNVCLFPDSGLLFHAAEAEKMGIYYIPELGHAPKWCSFLDNLTEELEESNNSIVYDDYKFVTKQDLENFGLSHLVGTNMLRAYMHGYFMDVKLYHQVKTFVDPFAYDKYRKEKIKSKIELERASRIKTKKLPKVNKQLAEKLMENSEMKQKKKENYANALEDKRFSALFENPDFEIDEESEQYKLLHPVLSKYEKSKKVERSEMNGKDEDNISDNDNEISDNEPQLYQVDKNTTLRNESKKSLAEMLNETNKDEIIKEKGTVLGSKEITFKMNKSEQQQKKDEDVRKHKIERKTLRRSAGNLTSKQKNLSTVWKRKSMK